MKEYILCASIHFDDGKEHPHQPKNIKTGFVICGLRHSNCFQTLSSLLQDRRSLREHIFNHNKESQGFLTSLNRHVDRNEAWNIAYIADQIVRDLDINKKTLFSENLY